MRVLSSAAIFALAACLIGCRSESLNEDPVVLEVGGRAVTLSELDRFVEASAQQESPFLPGDVLAALLEQFIEEQLLLRAADEAAIEVDEAALAKRLQALSGSEPVASGDGRAFAESVEQKLRIEQLLEKDVLGEVSVTDQEIASDYEQNRAYYSMPETVQIAQILVEEEALAKEILQELSRAPSRFQELAREHSIGPEASMGGRMGSFGQGELPPSLERAVFALRPGRLSEIVATDFGYHIFLLEQRLDSRHLDLEEVADAIRVDLLRRKSDEAIALYTESLRDRFPVHVYGEHLSFAFLDRDEISVSAGSELEERE